MLGSPGRIMKKITDLFWVWKSQNLHRAWYTSGTLIHGLLALFHFYLTINPWASIFIPILNIHTDLRHRGETWFAHRLKSRQNDSTTSFSVFPGSKTRMEDLKMMPREYNEIRDVKRPQWTSARDKAYPLESLLKTGYPGPLANGF